MAYASLVSIYRTPPKNASGAMDGPVLQNIAVDIQEADDNPHQRDPGFGVSTMQLQEWYDIYLRDWRPMPDIRERDRVVDVNTIDPLMNNQPTTYRVRRVRQLDGCLRCEKISTPPSGSMSGG